MRLFSLWRRREDAFRLAYSTDQIRNREDVTLLREANYKLERKLLELQDRFDVLTSYLKIEVISGYRDQYLYPWRRASVRELCKECGK